MAALKANMNAQVVLTQVVEKPLKKQNVAKKSTTKPPGFTTSNHNREEKSNENQENNCTTKPNGNTATEETSSVVNSTNHSHVYNGQNRETKVADKSENSESQGMKSTTTSADSTSDSTGTATSTTHKNMDYNMGELPTIPLQRITPGSLLISESLKKSLRNIVRTSKNKMPKDGDMIPDTSNDSNDVSKLPTSPDQQRPHGVSPGTNLFEKLDILSANTSENVTSNSAAGELQKPKQVVNKEDTCTSKPEMGESPSSTSVMDTINSFPTKPDNSELLSSTTTEKTDIPVVTSNGPVCGKRPGSASSEESDSKRFKSSVDSTLSDKSRLSDVIGRLGSNIGITEEKLKDLDTKDEDHEEEEDEDEEEDTTGSSESGSEPSTPTITQTDLQTMIRNKLNDYMERLNLEVEKAVAPLQKRVAELQAANDVLKALSSDLQRKLVESGAGKASDKKTSKVSTRSISIQVDQGKLLQPTPTSVTLLTPISQPSKVINTSVPSVRLTGQQQQVPSTKFVNATTMARVKVNTTPLSITGQTVRDMLNKQNTPKTAVSIINTGAISQPSMTSQGKVVTAKPNILQGSKRQFIDLTAEDDGNRTLNSVGFVPVQPPLSINPSLVQQHLQPVVPQTVVQQQTGQITMPTGLVSLNPGTSIYLTAAPTGNTALTVAPVNPTTPTTIVYQTDASKVTKPTAIVTVVNTPTPQPTTTTVIASTQPVKPTVTPASNTLTTVIPMVATQASKPVTQPSQVVVKAVVPTATVQPSAPVVQKHPAPLPATPEPAPGQKLPPPKPGLKISRVAQGIVLSWNMTLDNSRHEEIARYQLYAYQEGSLPPSTSLWKRVGDVKALPLPMACTLTQFQEGNHYHFAVRAIDSSTRYGPFSEPCSIHLLPNNTATTKSS